VRPHTIRDKGVKNVLESVRRIYSRLALGAWISSLPLSTKISVPFLLLFVCMSLYGTAVFGHWLSASQEESSRGKVEGLAALVLRNSQDTVQNLQLEARLIADGDAVRGAVAAGDSAALTKALMPTKAVMGLGFVKVVDSTGKPLIDLRDHWLVGARLADDTATRRALAGLSLGGLISAETRGATMLVGVAPVKSTEGVVGGIVLGLPITNDFVHKISAGTGEELLVYSGSELIATTLQTPRDENWQPPSPGEPPTRTTIGTGEYLAKRVDLDLSGEATGLTLVVLDSPTTLDDAQRLLWIRLGSCFLLGIVIAAILGANVARAISRPLVMLTQVTERLAWGDLRARASVSSKDEVGELGRAFNAMGEQLEERNRNLSVALEELEHRQEDLLALNRVATQLAHVTDSDEVLSTGLKLAAEATGLRSGAIWLLRHGGLPELVSHWGVTPRGAVLLSDLPRLATALWSKIISGESLLLDQTDVRTLPIPSDLEGEPPDGAVAAPLFARGAVLGGIALYGSERRACSDTELQVLQAIGAAIGLALENARRYEEARYLADHDPVTGLLNHRAFHQRLAQETKRAQRGFQELSVVMMDLDNFKLFNDTYGHPAGDTVLREIASVLSEATRDSDVLGRYGGDEFVALLPETGADGALTLAERFRAAMASRPFVPQGGPAVPIQMSFGIATFPHDAQSSHELVGCADVNLYRSKQRGGDAITSAEDSSMDADDIGAFGIMDGLVTAVDNKDHYTRQHSEQVTSYAAALAEELGLSEDSQRTLRIAGLLHDVGKIGVPDRILRKPGRLTADERDVIKQHARLGEMIIKEVPNIADVLAAVGSHHERLDGAGYPRGLKGEEIPLLGRILAVADSYSAMTSDRPYRKALTLDQAREQLLKAAGTQLDTKLVHLFLSRLESVEVQA
jgi:diguanylate cyclase (GGDEF)-like protein/putative nucleotidyltransferase with HDIG domain